MAESTQYLLILANYIPLSQPIPLIASHQHPAGSHSNYVHTLATRMTKERVKQGVDEGSATETA